MEGQIIVTPEELLNTADEFNSQGTQIGNLTSEMMSTVTGLSAAWEGEAAQVYIEKFKGLEDDIQRMIAMITEHVTDLQEMANAYSQAEQANMDDINNSLRSDVIV